MTITENKAVRLFWLMRAFDAGAVVCARQVAEAYGMRLRSAQRDLLALCDLGHIEAYGELPGGTLWCPATTSEVQ